jgi:hypothetical protein
VRGFPLGASITPGPGGTWLVKDFDCRMRAEIDRVAALAAA